MFQDIFRIIHDVIRFFFRISSVFQDFFRIFSGCSGFVRVFSGSFQDHFKSFRIFSGSFQDFQDHFRIFSGFPGYFQDLSGFSGFLQDFSVYLRIISGFLQDFQDFKLPLQITCLIYHSSLPLTLPLILPSVPLARLPLISAFGTPLLPFHGFHLKDVGLKRRSTLWHVFFFWIKRRSTLFWVSTFLVYFWYCFVCLVVFIFISLHAKNHIK